MNATITLREYLAKEKTFVVPNYQRGYVWGKGNRGKHKDAATYMMDSLINAYKTGTGVFIQGVTVSELDKEIDLIDGQQRTTFFYLLMKSLGYKSKFNIRYEIRKESNDFLSKEDLLDDMADKREEPYQDIYYFKKTLRVVNERIGEVEDKDEFRDYILDNVKFLYIDIPKEKATKVFTMMNGNKAEMKPEELIKAELLRLASLAQFDARATEKEIYAVEWDNNMLRSRYAREWDKWLQWWNRKDVSDFYKVNRVMGLLVSTCQLDAKDKTLSFETFKQTFLQDQTPKKAKDAFDKLRRLQKRFEDAFNAPKIYNMIGAILRVSGDTDEFLKWYFLNEKPSEEQLAQYYKYAFIGLTHREIMSGATGADSKVINKDSDGFKKAFESKYQIAEQALMSNNLYYDNPDAAFKLLLRLNIDQDNLQEDGKGRKFDFSIWDNKNRGRSLEHIYPKSKVYHLDKDEDGNDIYLNGSNEVVDKKKIDESSDYMDRATCFCEGESGEVHVASEHSIGNLVLLYRDDNSAFNDKSFEDKKNMFFNAPDRKNEKAIFKSRHLLHTIYKFANSHWIGEDIAKNKEKTLDDFRNTYHGEKQD